jgi:DNA recombination protein RmuC
MPVNGPLFHFRNKLGKLTFMTTILLLLLGVAVGGLIATLILRERLAGVKSNLEIARSRLSETEARISNLQSEHSSLNAELASARVKLSEQQRAFDEKLAFRETLQSEFKVLASDILEDKSRKFTEQNQTNLDALLRPLGTQIAEFKTKVEQSYEQESQQRVSLTNEIEKLRGLSERMDQDAISLTSALKGQSKTLGNWGEFILEEILEKAGLVKEREYSVRQTLTGEDGRRSQPDVIVMLPENRHLVIDSKINLSAYLRHCSSENEAECELELRKHIAGIRVHLKELDLKAYQDHYQLNTLDFVLMFVPLEPAFIVAVRKDPTLFDDAFAKRIVLVCPSTLLATMRTVRNIWRQEDQKRNVLEIANQSGALYDKFVGFVDDLKDIGMRLKQTQDSYEAAHNKLTSGKGNLVSRAEKVRQLGAKASKRLPLNLVGTAREGDEPEAIDSNSAAPETMQLFEEGLFPELLPAEENETASLSAKGAAGDQ